MSTMLAPNPQTSSGTGGAGMISAPPTDDPNFALAPVQGFSVPGSWQLSPQAPLPANGAPLGAYTDSQYLADDAALRQQIGQQYGQILQQLGYTDPATGQTIPGSVVSNANIQAAQIQQQRQMALKQVVQNAQNNGTIFSGVRATQTADADNPYQNQLGQLTLTTGQNLNDLYDQAQNLVAGYNTQNNQNIASAAARNLALIQANQLAAIPAGGAPGPGTSDDHNDAGDASQQSNPYANTVSPAGGLAGTLAGGAGKTFTDYVANAPANAPKLAPPGSADNPFTHAITAAGTIHPISGYSAGSSSNLH